MISSSNFSIEKRVGLFIMMNRFDARRGLYYNRPISDEDGIPDTNVLIYKCRQ